MSSPDSVQTEARYVYHDQWFAVITIIMLNMLLLGFNKNCCSANFAITKARPFSSHAAFAKLAMKHNKTVDMYIG